jgi:hypothetical protein
MEEQTVTKEEFDRFLKEYPRKLEIHGVNFCSPPHVEYQDWSLPSPHKLGTFEYKDDCTVARVICHSEMAVYGPQYAKPDEHRITRRKIK